MAAAAPALLTTKLSIPRAGPRLVQRPRLTEWLDAGAESKLTLISAPAGWGKTTLLAEWLASPRVGGPVAWVSLDEGDDDPTRFWAYVIAALETLHAGVGATALALLRATPPTPIESVLAALLNDLAAAPTDVTLVLDDYHAIVAPPVHRGVTFLLDHLPHSVRLVVATRVDPPLPLARLRARGELTELRAPDLRFEPDEAVQLLNRVMGLRLSAGDVAALEARTEGWAAGLHLAALSLRGRADPASFIAGFGGSHRYVFDYLVDEVFRQQPEDVRAFLLRTSILERLGGPLCDTVTEGRGGQAMLERLETANLFVVPLDEERHWYRYHQLFADALRERLHQSHPELIPELHGRASAWHEQDGSPDDAIRHAVAAGRPERAACLIEQAADAMWMDSRATTLLRWVEALPHELVRSRPRLSLVYAWAVFFTDRVEAVEACLAHAERSLRADDGRRTTDDPRSHPVARRPSSVVDSEAAELWGMLAAIRACLASMRGDAAATIEQARLASQGVPERNVAWRSVVALSLGTAYRSIGDVAAASATFEQAGRLSRLAGNTSGAVWGDSNLALLHVMQGRLTRAADVYQRALSLTDGPRLPMAGLALVGLAELLRERDDLDAARDRALEGIELGERGSYTEIRADGYVTLARIRLAQGDPDAAVEALRLAERLAPQHNVSAWVAARMATCRVRLWLARGDLPAATRWARDRGLSADAAPSYPHEAEHLALARITIAQGRPVQALTLLSRLHGAAEAAERIGSVLEILVLRARALWADGRADEALLPLARALACAEPEGYVRLFVDEGEPMAALLARLLETDVDDRPAAQHGADRSYLEALRARLRQSAAPPTSTAVCPRPTLEPLSAREREVLRLIAAGLSNREVAEALVVSVGTIKTHLIHLYGKLDVHSRTRAVARARELDLLPT